MRSAIGQRRSGAIARGRRALLRRGHGDFMQRRVCRGHNDAVRRRAVLPRAGTTAVVAAASLRRFALIVTGVNGAAVGSSVCRASTRSDSLATPVAIEIALARPADLGKEEEVRSRLWSWSREVIRRGRCARSDDGGRKKGSNENGGNGNDSRGKDHGETPRS